MSESEAGVDLSTDAFVDSSVQARIQADSEVEQLRRRGDAVDADLGDELWRKNFQGSRFFSQYRSHQHQRAALKRQLAINREEL